jgi:hypothetical protein
MNLDTNTIDIEDYGRSTHVRWVLLGPITYKILGKEHS